MALGAECVEDGVEGVGLAGATRRIDEDAATMGLVDGLEHGVVQRHLRRLDGGVPYPRSLRQLLALARRDELVAHLLGLVVLHLRRRRCLRHRTLFRREPKVEGIELLAAALHTLLDVQEHTCADDGVACVGARLAELVAVVLAHLVPKGFEQPRRVLGLVEDEDVCSC